MAYLECWVVVDSSTHSKTLLFATRNERKFLEARLLLSSVAITLVSPPMLDEHTVFDIEETGSTFSENAELKAKGFSAEFSLPAVADDSGLEVNALKGAPGVRSRRWHPGSDADRNTALLNALSGSSDRSAHFVTVLCLFNPTTQKSTFFEGIVKGSITLEPRGSSTFGYDPVFVPDGLTQTFAEMTPEEKNTISHRALAFKKLASYLKK